MGLEQFSKVPRGEQEDSAERPTSLEKDRKVYDSVGNESLHIEDFESSPLSGWLLTGCHE